MEQATPMANQNRRWIVAPLLVAALFLLLETLLWLHYDYTTVAPWTERPLIFKLQLSAMALAGPLWFLFTHHIPHILGGILGAAFILAPGILASRIGGPRAKAIAWTATTLLWLLAGFLLPAGHIS